ncbi:MAG: hypothetical protein ACJ75T_12395 [Solirubrobacterales bacterium]
MPFRTCIASLLVFVAGLVAAQPAAAGGEGTERTCELPNAAGTAVERAAAPSQTQGVEKHQGKGTRGKAAAGSAAAKRRIALQAEPASANRVVNLGTDREAEEVTLHVTVSSKAPPNFEKHLGVVAEPFANTSETGDTVTFSEPTFSTPELSENRKRVTFTMCVDAPNDLPAGKYTSLVLLEGPPSVEPAVMTVTINAKDGGIFLWLSVGTALLAAFVLLYKSAGEKRTLLLAEAQKIESEDEREDALEKARSWRCPIWDCIKDLGWWVPTVAAVGSAFAVLYAAYAANPAWGEGGIVPSAIALIGTGLAAVGAKTVFTQSSSGN